MHTAIAHGSCPLQQPDQSQVQVTTAARILGTCTNSKVFASRSLATLHLPINHNDTILPWILPIIHEGADFIWHP